MPVSIEFQLLKLCFVYGIICIRFVIIVQKLMILVEMGKVGLILILAVKIQVYLRLSLGSNCLNTNTNTLFNTVALNYVIMYPNFSGKVLGHLVNA